MVVYLDMLISNAMTLVRETGMLRHLSINTEKSYIHWLRRYGAFLLNQRALGLASSAEKLGAFLTSLAKTGISASTQNQAFNALLFFYREVLKEDLGRVDAPHAKRPAGVRQCPSQAETYQLLSAVTDIYHYPTRLIVYYVAHGLGMVQA